MCRRFPEVFVAMANMTQAGPSRGTRFRGGVQLNLPESIKSSKYFFYPNFFLGDLPPPPRRQKIFGQCTILGIKYFFRT